MAKIWTEIYDSAKHHDRMRDVNRLSDISAKKYCQAPTLQQYPVYFARVCNFTFEFHNLEQLKTCLDFFSKKVRPSSIIRFTEADRKIYWLHWFAQRWFERLPMKLLEERRRVKIVPALKQALKQFTKESKKKF
ncbi:MAG TPA: hypothetical protein VHG89_03350 [Verrucomicrobiae bacterium]|nr:hypothetical protein [Verrucomicrobiae bacterium]